MVTHSLDDGGAADDQDVPTAPAGVPNGDGPHGMIHRALGGRDRVDEVLTHPELQGTRGQIETRRDLIQGIGSAVAAHDLVQDETQGLECSGQLIAEIGREDRDQVRAGEALRRPARQRRDVIRPGHLGEPDPDRRTEPDVRHCVVKGVDHGLKPADPKHADP